MGNVIQGYFEEILNWTTVQPSDLPLDDKCVWKYSVHTKHMCISYCKIDLNDVVFYL